MRGLEARPVTIFVEPEGRFDLTSATLHFTLALFILCYCLPSLPFACGILGFETVPPF